jgi:hypothetical protein
VTNSRFAGKLYRKVIIRYVQGPMMTDVAVVHRGAPHARGGVAERPDL